MEDFPPDVTLNSEVELPAEVTFEARHGEREDFDPEGFPEDVSFNLHQDGAGSDGGVAKWVQRIHEALLRANCLHKCGIMLRVMIDCCGILAPIIALELLCGILGVKFELVGVSDNDPFILEFIHAHFNPQITWPDMLERCKHTASQRRSLYKRIHVHSLVNAEGGQQQILARGCSSDNARFF